MDRLKVQGPFFFVELFDQDRTISEFVVTFLALLELVQMGLVRIVQPHLEADILLEPHFKEDEDNHHGESLELILGSPSLCIRQALGHQ